MSANKVLSVTMEPMPKSASILFTSELHRCINTLTHDCLNTFESGKSMFASVLSAVNGTGLHMMCLVLSDNGILGREILKQEVGAVRIFTPSDFNGTDVIIPLPSDFRELKERLVDTFTRLPVINYTKPSNQPDSDIPPF